jgi:hypothetical protein
MRSNLRLGPVNFALVSAYFAPAWGREALRVLTSPYANGFQDRAHAVAAIYFRDVFDLGLASLIRMSEMLAGLKLVIAAAFAAYLVEFVQAVVMRREPDRQTVDVVLLLALVAAVLWILPVLKLGDPHLIRLQATQFLLLVGAATVIMIERQIEDSAQARAASSMAAPVGAALVAAVPSPPAQAPTRGAAAARSWLRGVVQFRPSFLWFRRLYGGALLHRFMPRW